MTNPKFTFIDLFAGIGGFHHALSSLGGECVLACEFDSEAERVYRSAFPELRDDQFVSNIRSVTRSVIDDENALLTDAEIRKRVPKHDVLCGGFPCQPFSKSGAQLGVQDKTRGTLFFDIMQIIRAREPRFVMLENVRNLAGPRHTETWAVIIASLRDAGYRVSDTPVVLTPHLIPSEHGGAPQARDRVFILAERIETAAERKRGQVQSAASKRATPLLTRDYFADGHDPDDWSVADLLLPDNAISNVSSYRLSVAEQSYLDAWDYFVRNIETDDLPGFPIWVHAFHEEADIPEGCPDWKRNFLIKNADFYCRHRAFLDDWLGMEWGPERKVVSQFPFSRQQFEWQARKHHPTAQDRTISDLVLQMRPSGIRVKPPTYLPALVAITQTSIVGPGVLPGIEHYRRLTPEEAAKLQGIPHAPFAKAGVDEAAAYKQLGNAVNVGVVTLAFRALAGEALLGKGEGAPARPPTIEAQVELDFDLDTGS